MTDKQHSGKWPFLYVDGKLVGPVNVGAAVRVYPHVGLENLAGLHRRPFKSVEDMFAAVRTLLPKARRLELREDMGAAVDLLETLNSTRLTPAGPLTVAMPSRNTPGAPSTKRRTRRT